MAYYRGVHTAHIDMSYSTQSAPGQSVSGFAFAKFLLPIIFLVVGIGVYQYLVDSKATHAVPSPAEKTWSVQVSALTAQQLAPEIEIQATVEAPDRYHAAAPGEGWVDYVGVREGDRVTAGALIFSVDPRDFTTSVTQANAELADIEAQLVEGDIRYTQNKAALVDERKILKLNRKAVERSQKLQTQSLSSESDLENAQQATMRQQLMVNQRELEVKSYDSKKQQLEARKKRALAQIERVNRALERSRVMAPFDGIVSKVNVAVGGHVNAGSELVSLYSPADLEIRGLIPARYQGELAIALADGQTLHALSDPSGIAYTLIRLSGDAKPGGVDGFFRALDTSKNELSPGGLITLKLKRPLQQGLYVVPPSAIYDNSRVYLLREGRLFGAPITIIGQARIDHQATRLVRSSEIRADDQLVLTRLPNATTGLKAEAIDGSVQ